MLLMCIVMYYLVITDNVQGYVHLRDVCHKDMLNTADVYDSCLHMSESLAVSCICLMYYLVEYV